MASCVGGDHKQGAPEFHGVVVIGSWSFPCPLYQNVPLSLALSPRIFSEVAKFKPDIVHATSHGIMIFGALAIAKTITIPILLSYESCYRYDYSGRLMYDSSYLTAHDSFQNKRQQQP